ncbi:MAG TPA: TolC family protein [Gemmatimonadales bacterium]|nr:TolC family protein [Gemmatimonadales bacterium]
MALAGSAELNGQSPADADSLLRRLTAEAQAAAPAVLRSDALARAASTRVRPSGALPDPMLTLGVMDLTLPRFGFRQSDFTEVDVEVSQQFPWPGTLSSQTRAARAMARGAEAETSALRREIAVRVAMLYYRLRYVVTAKQTLAQQRTLVESTVEISTARYGTGSVPQSDPLQARVALARLVTEQASLQAEESSVQADLRAARGIRGPEQLSVVPIDVDSVAAILEDAEAGHALHLAQADPLATHPRLEARQAAIEAAEATVRAEALSARPDFEVSTRYGARPLGADFFSAFVGIRIPLWAGRKQRLLTQAARIDAEASQRGLDEEHAALTAELERTLADARAGAVRLRLLASSVLPLTREGVGAALRGYRTGQNDFLSVFAALDTHYHAELEATEVAAEHLTHLVMLEQLLEPEKAP